METVIILLGLILASIGANDSPLVGIIGGGILLQNGNALLAIFLFIMSLLGMVANMVENS